MLTLVRDTYRAGDDAGELPGLRDAAGHPASSQDITGHLLDRMLPAAYTRSRATRRPAMTCRPRNARCGASPRG
jgi:hypothetical protein